MKSFHELQEGVYDPNIFKAFFLAGGPGSGKSYVVRRTTGGTGLKIVNSDDAFEKLLKDAGLSLKMPPEEEQERDVARSRAKQITKARQTNYIEGRLGLIIDGTGKDYDKIARQSQQLRELGYDTYMIFVNTSLDTALERNAKRARSVPESIVVQSWKDVQSNIGKFNNHFGSGMIIVDNNDAGEDVFSKVWKRVQGLLRNKVKNGRAKAWIAKEMQKKRR
jgi:dephospho-CoA kinase